MAATPFSSWAEKGTSCTPWSISSYASWRREKTLSNSQGKGEVSGAATELLYVWPPLPSVGEGAGSRQEGQTTPTPSPPKAAQIHCYRQKVTQERKK